MRQRFENKIDFSVTLWTKSGVTFFINLFNWINEFKFEINPIEDLLISNFKNLIPWILNLGIEFDATKTSWLFLPHIQLKEAYGREKINVVYHIIFSYVF